MKCEKCEAEIKENEERDYYGKTLCEDCYMDALSPVRSCDPWAVHSAKNLGEKGSGLQVNPVQSKILAVLLETGGLEPRNLADEIKLSPIDLEREVASLRHMEKVRAELRDGRKFIVLW
jgi:hypothetical protein